MILDICRVCENKNRLLRIFENGNDEIATKLIDFANVEIEESDDLPQFICLQCFKELENAHSFKVKCQKTDRKFRNAIELQKTDLENFIDIEEQFTNKVEQNNDNDFEIKHKKLYDKEFMSDSENSNYSEESINEQTDNYMNEEYILGEENDSDIVINKPIDFIGDIRASEEDDFVEHVDIAEINHEKSKQIESTKIHKCNTCKKEFLKFSDLKIHKKSHGNKRWKCEICLQWFSKNYRIKRHMDTHKKLIFPCSLCKNKYTNRGNLDRHIRNFHKKEKRFTCEVCGLKFYRSTSLVRHLATHTNERNFVCECGKSFKTKDYLESHKKTHIPIEIRRMQNKSEKPFQVYTCPHCNKISNTSLVHNNHLKKHTEEKRFKCKFCGIFFRKSSNLKDHELIHSGIKVHKCEFCDKSFTLKGNLTVHLRLHTGETPYHCDKCDKKFYNSNVLQRHKKSHKKDNNISEEINSNEELSTLDPINVYLYDQESDIHEYTD